MKKIVVMLLLGAIVLMSTACSAKDDAIIVGFVNDGSGVIGSESGISIFGKVKSIVGNEIELEIAELPFEMNEGDMMGDSSDPEIKEFVWNSDEELPEGLEEGIDGDLESSTVVIAISGEDGQMQVVGGDGGAKLDLKYTGETKSITIPTGIEIMNMLGGTGTLDDITKGAVLMIGVDDENASALKAMNILIME